jgi:hypothetical protein
VDLNPQDGSRRQLVFRTSALPFGQLSVEPRARVKLAAYALRVRCSITELSRHAGAQSQN